MVKTSLLLNTLYMKKLILATIGTLLLLSGFSQNIIKGVVYDKESKKTIPYATIGVKGLPRGTVSNMEGQFEVDIDKNNSQQDSILISCVGYEIARYAINSFDNNMKQIYMIPKAFKVDKIVVSSDRKTREITIGSKSILMNKLHVTLFISSERESKDRIGREFGVLLDIKKSCIINNFNLYISRNDYKSIKFRLLFYSVENKLPKDILNNQDIIVDISNFQRGWFKVDISDYLISFEAKEQIAVILMLVDDETDANRNDFSVTGRLTKGNRLLRRDNITNEWTRSMGSMCLYLDATAFLD